MLRRLLVLGQRGDKENQTEFGSIIIFLLFLLLPLFSSG
jgi:hypothetical protein